MSDGHTGHFVLKCRRCEATLAQCRCASRDKPVHYQDGCADCVNGGRAKVAKKGKPVTPPQRSFELDW